MRNKYYNKIYTNLYTLDLLLINDLYYQKGRNIRLCINNQIK